MKKIIILITFLIMLLSLKFLNNNKYFYIELINEKVNSNISNIVKNNKIYITKSGTYKVTGTSKKYTININSKGNIVLILEDVNLINKENIIKIDKAKSITIQIKGTTTLSSLNNNTIKSTAKTMINGKGKLNIESNEGLNVKNSLIIENLTLNINTISDAIYGNNIEIKNSCLNIKTNGAYTLDNQNGRYIIKDDKYYKVAKSEVKDYKELYSLVNSSKGLKADKNIEISTSKLNINSIDDSIHSKNEIELKSNKIELITNDDAITSDKKIKIDNNEINISKSFEGIESQNIVLKENNIKINALNDGINIKTVDNKVCNECKLNINSSNINTRVGGDGFDISGNVNIYNSNVEIFAEDDGLQSQELFIKGGILKVYVDKNNNNSIMSKVNLIKGEILLGQVHDKFYLETQKLKMPNIKISNINNFKIINDKDEEIISTDNKICNFHYYVNSDLEIDNSYYLIYNNNKKIIKFNN